MGRILDFRGANTATLALLSNSRLFRAARCKSRRPAGGRSRASAFAALLSDLLIRLASRRATGAQAAIVLASTATLIGGGSAAADEALEKAGDAALEDQNYAPETDFLRPQNLVEISPLYNLSNGSPRDTNAYRLRLRADRKFSIDNQWTLGFRTDARFESKNPISAANPAGDFVSGIGDVDFQASLVRTFNPRWAAGFGARLFAPTGGDNFGAGRWRIMPGGAFRYTFSDADSSSYLEPLLRYDVSFAGDPQRRNIRSLQFAPTVALGLPQDWYVEFYPSPDIRWNFGDPLPGQTGRLFLPFDAKIGKALNKNVEVSFEASAPIVQDYPVYKLRAILSIDIRY
jgi:hypothetical protein